MRYRTFPVARPRGTAPGGASSPGAASSRDAAANDKPHGKPRRVPWTWLGALFIAGGLLRLATDDTTVEIGSRDLTPGDTLAASSEHEPEPNADDAPGDSKQKPKRGPNQPEHLEPIDVALVSLLLNK